MKEKTEIICTRIINEMDWHYVGGSEFAAMEVLEQVHQLNSNINKILNNWNNEVDDRDFNNMTNGISAVDNNNVNHFYVKDEL